MDGGYKKLGIMLFISFFIMYGVMFLNVTQADLIYLSVTRLYMALLMVLPMASLMLLVMPKMFMNKRVNAAIHVVVVIGFVAVVALLRSQTPISDEQYVRAMIPHHSSAILTSENADIKDPEVKNLSLQIIESQRREIAEMQAVLERLEAQED